MGRCVLNWPEALRADMRCGPCWARSGRLAVGREYGRSSRAEEPPQPRRTRGKAPSILPDEEGKAGRMATVWQELSHFESRDLLTDLYRRAHGGSLKPSKAYAIVASLGQGRAYFRSAERADELGQPLLLYYGVVALSRSLTLFLSPTLGEEGLAQAHGVLAKDWLGTLGGGEASNRIRHLQELRVGIARGTFTDLVTATDGLERAQIVAAQGTGLYTIETGGQTEFGESDELTLRDLLSRIPDLSRTYARTFDDYSRCLETKVSYRESTDDTIFEVLETHPLGLPTPELLRARLLLPPWLDIEEGERRSFLEPGRRLQAFVLHHPNEADAEGFPTVVHDAAGATYLVAQRPDEVRPSLLGSLFLTSYVMGMLVRYHPSLWFALVRSCRPVERRLHASDTSASCGRR